MAFEEFRPDQPYFRSDNTMHDLTQSTSEHFIRPQVSQNSYFRFPVSQNSDIRSELTSYRPNGYQPAFQRDTVECRPEVVPTNNIGAKTNNLQPGKGDNRVRLKDGPKRRLKKKSPQQNKALEEEFDRKKYISPQRRQELSNKLNLTEAEVSTNLNVLI